MHQPVLSLLALFAGTVLINGVSSDTLPVPTDQVVINTTSGNIHGFTDPAYPNVRNFFGIPYAQAPIGSLRWMPPQPITKPREIIATHRPPTCMQKFLAGGVYDGPFMDFVTDEGQSEDCLFLSVYAPKTEHIKGPVPVVVFFFGGGFVAGGSDPPYERAGSWIERSKSHIVVTVNLEWVRDNIAAFGGDPKRISMMGQSAGAGSVAFYPYIWTEDPIVAGLIAHSSVGHAINSTDYKHSNFSSIANRVKCFDLEPKDELACMKNVDAVLLSQTIAEYTVTAKFMPVADNVTVFNNFAERMARGLYADIPMLAGDNALEASASVLQPRGTLRIPAEMEQLGFHLWNCQNAKEMGIRVENGHTTYRYHYEGNFTNISPLPYIGAAHSAELPMIFNTHELNGKSTDFQLKVAETMQDLWLAFITNPRKDPMVDNITWPKYNRDTQSTLVFAANRTVTQLVDRMYIERRC